MQAGPRSLTILQKTSKRKTAVPIQKGTKNGFAKCSKILLPKWPLCVAHVLLRRRSSNRTKLLIYTMPLSASVGRFAIRRRSSKYHICFGLNKLWIHFFSATVSNVQSMHKQATYTYLKNLLWITVRRAHLILTKKHGPPVLWNLKPSSDRDPSTCLHRMWVRLRVDLDI